MGHNTKQVIEKLIPGKIRQQLKDKRCSVLSTSNVEIDHKDGRRDDPRPPDELEVDDFQPLSKVANNAKRQHCKKCRAMGKRFDAKWLGYRKGQVHGNCKYAGICVGCYWHDPFYFNSEISQNDQPRSHNHNTAPTVLRTHLQSASVAACSKAICWS